MGSYFVQYFTGKQFTRAQEVMANYFVENDIKIYQKSLQEIADEVGYSDVTVLRFVRELGFSGFKELREDLGKYINKQLGEVSLVDRHKLNKESRQSKNYINEYVEMMKQNLQMTLLQNKQDQYNLSVNMIANSKTVYVGGFRGSRGVRTHFARCLQFVTNKVVEIEKSSGNVFELLGGIGEGDVLIYIAFTRYYQIDVDVVRFAKESGAKIIIITNYTVSPLVPLSDELLLVRVQNTNVFNSIVATSCLIEYMVDMLCEINKEKLETNLQTYDKYAKNLRYNVE